MGTRPGLWCPLVANGVKWDARDITVNLRTFDQKVDKIVTAAIAFHATRAVAYAKQNAPWVDRTSNARNGLFARPERDAPTYRIIIGHSVPYGVWLEVRWAGRYQIIRPTVDHEGPELMDTVSKMFSGMSRG